MALQVILSGVVGGLVILKVFWGNLMNFVLRRKPEEDEEAAQPEVEGSSYKADSSVS